MWLWFTCTEMRAGRHKGGGGELFKLWSLKILDCKPKNLNEVPQSLSSVQHNAVQYIAVQHIAVHHRRTL